MSTKRVQPSNVIPIIVAVALMGMFLSPLLPRLVKAVIPFPKLEEVVPLQGTFDYEGEWPTVKVPRYFVVNAEGRHEFRCGYFGGRQACFYRPEVFKGKAIRVWDSFWFGRIQHEVAVPAGIRPFAFDSATRTYEESRSTYLDPRYLASQKPNYLGIVLMSLFLCWLITKEVWRRQELREEAQKKS